MTFIDVTRCSTRLMSSLKENLPLNKPSMSVTPDVPHEEIGRTFGGRRVRGPRRDGIADAFVAH